MAVLWEGVYEARSPPQRQVDFVGGEQPPVSVHLPGCKNQHDNVVTASPRFPVLKDTLKERLPA